jgi:hypothetical protein
MLCSQVIAMLSSGQAKDTMSNEGKGYTQGTEFTFRVPEETGLK